LSNRLNKMKLKNVKKSVDENVLSKNGVLALDDKSITKLTDITDDFARFSHLTSLILAHNRLSSLTQAIGKLQNLEVLNCFNNQISELPSNIHELSKLRHLNLGMNKLNELPKRFNEMKNLEILDLTYNNLTESSVGENFWSISPLTKSLRVIYLSDNDFSYLPMDIQNFERLEILSLRDNDLVAIPEEIEKLTKIHELHLQGNLLHLIPPMFCRLRDNFIGQKKVLKLERNKLDAALEERRKMGLQQLFNYLASKEYHNLYQREFDQKPKIDMNERRKEKSKKISRGK